MKPAKVRNEWVDAFIETGKIIDEVPKHLIEGVKERAELRTQKPKVEDKEVKTDDLRLR